MAVRQLGIAVDFSESSNAALRWAIDNLLRDGDKLILVIVLKRTDAVESPEQLWGADGSPLIPYVEFVDACVMKRYGVTVSPAIAESLTKLQGSKSVEILAKVYYGDAKQKILDAIVELPLDSLCMGSRGLGGLKKVFLGSVSEYVVNNSPCPTTVVKLASEVGRS